MNHPSVLQTILLGTDRRKLPEETATSLGVFSSDVAEKTALEALSRAVLMGKAGFQPTIRTDVPADLPPADESGRPLLTEAALQFLKQMLEGIHAEGLPELLALLEESGRALPPELLPGLLDACMQQPEVSSRLLPLLGERGRWLARQNVRWYPLSVDPATTDWFTATFEARRQLLAITRQRNPMLAVAWLEKTWPEEDARHKVAFLSTFATRLSELDIDLLERAFQDKNREVRLTALGLLVRLPEGATIEAMRRFFAKRFAGAFPPDKREKYLQSTLPDLSEDALKPWFGLLDQQEKKDWRNGLFQLFVRYLPVSDLIDLPGKKIREIVAATDLGNNTGLGEALLENLLRKNSIEWVQAVWQQYCPKFRHGLWQKPVMQDFMLQNAESLMQHLSVQKIVLDYDSQFILRALEKYRNPWSKTLLDNLLQQYKTAIDGYMPGWHYAAALQTAAWHCKPAEGLIPVEISYKAANAYQPKEWLNFQQILRFRVQMHEATGTAGRVSTEASR